jgi:hypothetical protein
MEGGDAGCLGKAGESFVGECCGPGQRVYVPLRHSLR